MLIDVEPASHFSILNLIGVQHIVEDAIGLPANALMRRSLNDEFKSSIGKDMVEVF